MSNRPSNSPEPINLSVAWIILARAMCVSDSESIPIEEATAAKYAFGKLDFSEKVFQESKDLAYGFTVMEAAHFINSNDILIRKDFILGLISIALSDKTLRKEEIEFLASLSSFWKIESTHMKELCLLANTWMNSK